jgi:UDP-N-acetyl-D-glucosamine dehydrogenase
MNLVEKFENKTAVVGVIGLGYVGLPLLLGYAEKGFKVLGFDVDDPKVVLLNQGKSYIRHIGPDRVGKAVESGRLSATGDFARVGEVDVIFICVPTPLDAHLEPDLSYIRATRKQIEPHLRPGQILCLESTTYPGTTREEFAPMMAAKGFSAGKNFFLVFSPEREDPGNQKFSGGNIPKVVGGHTAECLRHGMAAYGALYEKLVPVSSTDTAEMVKLLENIFRAVNIGLVNEMKIVADAMGMDIWEIIAAAATKPFGFTPFYPGPGLGGHCIPIDPFYLTWKAREFGINTRFIELAGEINRSMPAHVVAKVASALNARRKPMNGSKILIYGLAYKPDVDDMRESPTFVLMDMLADQGAEVDYHDPHIPVVGPTREHRRWMGKKSVTPDAGTISSADLVLIATNHKAFDYALLIEHSDLIVDTRNAIQSSGLAAKPGQLVKA